MRKTCKNCGARRALSKFSRHRGTKDGLSPWCKECHNASVRKWRRENPKPPKPPKALLTPEQIELIRLIAKGLDVTEIAAELGIARENVKGRYRRIKFLLRVRRTREIPYAYWLKTGSSPFGSSEFEGRSGTSLNEVVEEMFNRKEEP